MEGISQYAIFWLMYLVCAAVGYWCWQRLFFWMKPGSDVRRFFYMLGAVLLFTPAPIEPDSMYFAPAMIVYPFTLLTTTAEAAMYAANWFLAGLVVGAIVLALIQMTRFVQNRLQPASDE
ncbi:hypothetical protein [Bacterioplanoides pacificum]|uniref:Uncharacterized protein n=1 Tax=Bacterioplanoides pacificum TaxID=1171596 RepID=A0ABV7VQR6_9GAMM